MNTKPSSSPLGPRRTLVAIAIILALGALAATLILRSGPPGAAIGRTEEGGLFVDADDGAAGGGLLERAASLLV